MVSRVVLLLFVACAVDLRPASYSLTAHTSLLVACSACRLRQLCLGGGRFSGLSPEQRRVVRQRLAELFPQRAFDLDWSPLGVLFE